MPYKNPAKQRAAALRSAKRRSKRNRAVLIAMLGGKCVVCGSTARLEFHHKDPSQKIFTIGRALKPMAAMIAEIKKCELRCHKHHIEVHATLHGSPHKYRYCRCRLCIEARRQYNAVWMARWRAAGRDKSRKNYKGP